MKLLLILAFIAATSAFDFDCLKGPVFWCSSLANAQKCNKVTECFMTEKNQFNNGKPKGDTREICKGLVSSLSKIVVNYNRKEFNNFLNTRICDMFKGESQISCKGFVVEYGSMIWFQFRNNKNPIKICRLFHDKGRLSLIKQIDNFKTSSPGICEKCKEFFKILESLFSKVTPDEIKFLLESLLCNQLPSEFQSMCKMLVEGYVGQLYQLIKSLLDGDRICPLLHLCTNSSIIRNADSWTCNTCLDIVVVLKKDLVNVSASTIVSLIKSAVCSKLSFIIRGVCNDYVGSIIPPLVNEVKSNMTPQAICSKNHLCATRTCHQPLKLETKNIIKCELCELAVKGLKKFLGTSHNVDLIKTFFKSKVCNHLKSFQSECSMAVDKYADILLHLIIDHVDANTICKAINACQSFTEGQSAVMPMKRLHHQNHDIKGIECEACHFVFERLKSFITDPTRETEIKNFLKTYICQVFPSETAQCQQIIDQYFTIVLNFLLSEFDADKICHTINMCSTRVKNDIECTLCEKVMDEVINVATSNRTEQIVQKFLISDICPHLEVFQTECVSLVNQYLPYIFAVARSTLNSKVLCQELHLCSMISKNMPFFTNMSDKTIKCEICQLILNETKSLLSDPKIQELIRNFIKNDICSHFGAEAQTCKNGVDEYFSLVVNFILTFLKPSLCSELGLCDAPRSLDNVHQKLINLVKSKKINDCPLCVNFYKYMKSINERDSDVNKIVGFINLCNLVDHTLKSECLKQFRNFDVLIKIYNKSRNMSDFCKLTKMCSKSSHSPFGAKPCTWGPRFWCISRQHASFCGYGAVQHCETNVWSRRPIL